MVKEHGSFTSHYYTFFYIQISSDEFELSRRVDSTTIHASTYAETRKRRNVYLMEWKYGFYLSCTLNARVFHIALGSSYFCGGIDAVRVGVCA